MAAPFDRSPLVRCLAVYAEMPWRFSITLLLFLVVNGSLAWQQWLIGHAVNEVQQGVVVVKDHLGELDYSRAVHWVLILVAVAGVRGLIQYGAGILALIIGQELLTIIRVRILEQVQRLDMAFHWRQGSGGLISLTTRDGDKLRDALVQFWRQVVETSLVVLSAVFILFWYNPLLGLVPLIVTFIGLTVLVIQTDGLVEIDRVVGAAYDSVNQDLTEGIHGVRVVKAFGLEAQRIESFQAQVGVFMREARHALAYSAKRIPVPQVVVATGHVWVLAYGAWLVGHGRLSVGELVAALLAANMLVLRIESIAPTMQTFADARSSAGRIWKMLDAKPDIIDGYADVPAGPLGLRFDGVFLPAPGGGNDILRELSFEVRPGELVAIVGPTGSGKSTLMALLPRLLDVNQGGVLVGSNKSGWANVRSLKLASLRQAIHVLPQESFLFADTLAANLRLADPRATDKELLQALHLAAADDVLAGLPEGLQTIIGDRGVTLSGGQRQRICLARALLAEASILGLDDATSALDAATERVVLENLRNRHTQAAGAATVLIVSSKLSTILMADRVLVLSGGRIVAEGTHSHLAATSRTYQELMGL